MCLNYSPEVACDSLPPSPDFSWLCQVDAYFTATSVKWGVGRGWGVPEWRGLWLGCATWVTGSFFFSYWWFFFFWLSYTTCEILVPWPENEPASSAVHVQSPNHWTAREFPGYWLLLPEGLTLKASCVLVDRCPLRGEDTSLPGCKFFQNIIQSPVLTCSRGSLLGLPRFPACCGQSCPAAHHWGSEQSPGLAAITPTSSLSAATVWKQIIWALSL